MVLMLKWQLKKEIKHYKTLEKKRKVNAKK